MNDFSKINHMQECVNQLHRQAVWRGSYPGVESISALSQYLADLHGALLALHGQAQTSLPDNNGALMRAREVLEIQK